MVCIVMLMLVTMAVSMAILTVATLVSTAVFSIIELTLRECSQARVV